jgi:hypothetical protein
MKSISQLLGWGFAVMVAAGCGSGRTISLAPSSGATIGGSTGSSAGGTTTVDFATQIQPIFDRNCALSGCHASDTASAGLILDAGQSYANLVNVASSEVGPDKRVAPGNSAASYLIEKLTRAQPRAGSRMPLGSEPLPDNQIALIRTWIDEGAHAARS